MKNIIESDYMPPCCDRCWQDLLHAPVPGGQSISNAVNIVCSHGDNLIAVSARWTKDVLVTNWSKLNG